MTRTVDLVICGGGPEARDVAVDALRRGRRVLVVLRSGDVRRAQQLRRWLYRAAGPDAGPLRVMTGAEVVCVDGVDAVEAIVVRLAATGRLTAVNASAFVRCDDLS